LGIGSIFGIKVLKNPIQEKNECCATNNYQRTTINEEPPDQKSGGFAFFCVFFKPNRLSLLVEGLPVKYNLET